MTKLVFVVPCHGRHQLATACLTQLRRTCYQLSLHGVRASACLVSDDDRFRSLARELRFDHVTQPNQPLGKKWNAGFYWASTGMKADYVIPFGSDDVIDPDFILDGGWPDPDTIRCCRRSAVVNPDGTRMSLLDLPYDGGDGVRIYPRPLLARYGFRPYDDGRNRAMDTNSVSGRPGAKLAYYDLHPMQVVDFKTSKDGKGANLNDYEGCRDRFGGAESHDPMSDLRPWFPEFVNDLENLYAVAA